MDQGRPLEGGALEHLLDVGGDKLQEIRIDQVPLGDYHDPLFDMEQVEDRQVLTGLGHDSFVSGHDEHCQVDAADTSEHVLHEALVAWHVDDADFLAVRELQPGETQVYGHLPGFFFFKAVRVDAGECRDQGRLAVVDVAGGTDDVHASVSKGTVGQG